MARYVGKVLSTRAADELFDYMSDFSNAEEWDPGTVRARRLDEGPVAVGSRVALRAALLGRESDLTYEVTELERPSLVVFRGENDAVVSVDRITFSSTGHDTAMTYEAKLTLKTPLGILFDPLLALAFNRAGDRALAHLREMLASGQPLRQRTPAG